MTETLRGLREWLGTYSGKLAAVAAGLGAVLADNAVTALGMADFIPAGWPRAVLLLAIAVATFVTPYTAQKKDAANADKQG